MDDNEYFALGHPYNIEVGVHATLDGQDIWIEQGNIGQRLACLLAMGQTDIVRREGAYFWRIAHNRQRLEGLERRPLISASLSLKSTSQWLKVQDSLADSTLQVYHDFSPMRRNVGIARL